MVAFVYDQQPGRPGGFQPVSQRADAREGDAQPGVMVAAAHHQRMRDARPC